MKTYSGRLWLVPHRDSKLRVEIELDDEKLRITSNDNLIGDWRLSELIVRSSSRTEVRLSAEGEELVIFTRDPDFMPTLAAHMAQAERAVSQAQRDAPSVLSKDSIDSNVVSFDRDRRAQPASASSSTHDDGVAAAGGSGDAAEASERDRGVHRADRRMTWKW